MTNDLERSISVEETIEHIEQYIAGQSENQLDILCSDRAWVGEAERCMVFREFRKRFGCRALRAVAACVLAHEGLRRYERLSTRNLKILFAKMKRLAGFVCLQDLGLYKVFIEPDGELRWRATGASLPCCIHR